MKLWDLVEILWEDSYMVHGWTHLDETGYEEEASLGHQSVGYYIGETTKQITICQSLKSDKDLNSQPETNVCGVFTIPKRAIISKRKLTPKGKS